MTHLKLKIRLLTILNVFFFIECSCPAGSERRVCNETDTISCCKSSCAIDNGGCEEGSRCVEVTNPSSNTSDCCPSVTCKKSNETLHHGVYIHLYVTYICISYNTGKSALPDIYVGRPRAHSAQG